jgi:hypothetical protein
MTEIYFLDTEYDRFAGALLNATPVLRIKQ